VDQHVISRWLLRAFARPGPGGAGLIQYDKKTDAYQETSPDAFLVEVDAHSPEIERGIERIETPASQAARRLAKRTRTLPPGFYAVVDQDEDIRAAGDGLADVGVVEGMRLLVSRFQIPSPSQVDRLALARYIGLMYQRAPKLEASIIRWGEEYDRAAQSALDRTLPGMKTGLRTMLAGRRSRMLQSAEGMGARLAAANWWVVRPDPNDSFVLSDCPVAATIALGHDDPWRAIFSQESFVVTMPLGPKIALVIAPQMVPFSNIDPADLTRAINRLIWRSADRYVLGRDRAILDAALPGADETQRRSTVDVAFDAEQVAAAATAQVVRIVAEVLLRQFVNAYLRADEAEWQRWDGCRLVFGRGQIAEGMPPDDRR